MRRPSHCRSLAGSPTGPTHAELHARPALAPHHGRPAAAALPLVAAQGRGGSNSICRIVQALAAMTCPQQLHHLALARPGCTQEFLATHLCLPQVSQHQLPRDGLSQGWHVQGGSLQQAASAGRHVFLVECNASALFSCILQPQPSPRPPVSCRLAGGTESFRAAHPPMAAAVAA